MDLIYCSCNDIQVSQNLLASIRNVVSVSIALILKSRSFLKLALSSKNEFIKKFKF